MVQIEILNGVEIKDFDVVRTLGAGGFGTCFEANYRGQRVALKVLNRTSKIKAATQSFKSETLPELYSFNHPNIVKLITASSIDADERFIILEFIAGRNLQTVIDDENEALPFERYANFGIDISSALHYINQFDIFHLDLKPANVMLTETGICKLTDFGCCQHADTEPSTPTRTYLTGTFVYRAPELLCGKVATPKADIYSLGISLWQFWSREFPYHGRNLHAVIFSVCGNDLRPEIRDDADIHEGFKALLKSCWDRRKEVRPTAKEVFMKLKSMLSCRSITKN